MGWNDQIALLQHSTTKAGGVAYDVFTDAVTVWADEQSIGYNEFYAASARNVDLQISYEVHTEDYNGQRYFMAGGKYYHVPRPYQKKGGNWVLAAESYKPRLPEAGA